MMLAAGKPRALLINNVVSLALFAIVVYVCAGYGLIATCIGVGIYRVGALVVGQYALGTRVLGIPLRETLVGDPGPAAVSTLALVAAAVAVSEGLASAPPVIDVAVTAAVGLAVYALVLRTLFTAAWSDITLLARRAVPQRLRPALHLRALGQ
jgi:hypothetical protein